MSITGIKFPFQFSSGRVRTSNDNEHVSESVKQIVGTNKFEYLMKPTFGCDVHNRVFDPVNVISLINSDVRDAIKEWDSRVGINSIKAYLTNADIGSVNILLDFFVKSLGQGSSNAEISIGG